MLSPGGRGRAARTAIPRGMMEDLTGWHEGDEPESPAEQVAPVDSFAKDLAAVKRSMVDNRRNINSAVSEVTKMYSDMSSLIDRQKEEIIAAGETVLRASQNNMLLEAKHMPVDLNLCEKRRAFGCQNPVLLAHIEDNISVVSGPENSADLIEIHPGKEISTTQTLFTDKEEVQAACLIDGGNHGISMTPAYVDEEKEYDVLLLGCEKGFVFKFQRPVNDKKAKWERAGAPL